MALHEEKVELLRKSDIFSQLREYELDIIARYSEIIYFKKGEIIFRHDSPSDGLYVVDKGQIGIIGVENQDDIVIAQIIAEESFGELDFFGKIKRSATAFAEIDSILLRFPAKGYKPDKIFQENAFVSANMLYRLLGIISERIWHVNKMLYDKSNWLHDLHKQILSDKMTGLYNQAYLKEDFINLLPELGKNAALLMIKPDNFKEINDGYGHDTGDKVLKIMAIFLESELNEKDIGIRYNGDEFAAILMNCNKDEAITNAKKISKAFKTMDLSSIIKSNDIRIQVSIGIALYPNDADNSQALVNAAHKKMLHARNAGGNRIFV